MRQVKALTMPADGSRGSQESELTRVVMSFQFEGDFSDRYWTCRLLEADKPTARRYREAASQLWNKSDEDSKRIYSEAYEILNRTIIEENPKEGGIEYIMWIRYLEDLKNAIKFSQISWQQRRVLELLLFEKIIRRMHEGANNILNEVWLCMRRKEESTQNKGIPEEETEEPDCDALDITTDSYFVTRKLIKQVQQILQAVEGDLKENIAQIVQWGNREKDRDAEKPRWTFHDESRYRATIKKLLASNEHAIQKLLRTHLKVSKFEALLTKTLEILRSDLDERHAGDIQRFTYVTVVFLPLGLATGVFSMSEAPRLETLRSMIVTAVVALTITAFSLFAAKLADDAGLLKLPEFIHRGWDIFVQSRRFAGVMQPESEKKGALGVKGRLGSSEGEVRTESKDDGTVLPNEPNAIGSARWFPITSWRRKKRLNGKKGEEKVGDVEGGVIAR
ncbi:hypothetical protein BDP81DRAFT_19444 [Colletotrichum phormii]|uniref:Uncharacterized protein n=1 Tax=Colletotrichum phormii TaxID=359342 RepID=A0AAJ0A5K1_9PEZI|nr:uncharacterized protein BDP81DRAFT_19444 [Colletotrichum phormii]KAK1656303.1 hypothetical protein BDP81DRAFT_19444 [Colletotrichum phormii]